MDQEKRYNNYVHLIGTKINSWTVIDIVTDGLRKVRVKVQCDCGTIKDYNMSYFMNGKTIDCGCGNKNRLQEIIKNKYKHLIDTTINDWTILEIIPSNDRVKHTTAQCKCQCGTIKNVKLSYILNGKSKNCGCGRKSTLSQINMNNLVGQKFGKLLVLEMLNERTKQGKIRYKCKCDCGNEVNVVGSSLTSGHTLSCGCLTSYWNMYINQLLKNNNIKFKAEYTVHVDDKYYRFDFYLPEYNLFIEYDGEQHYEVVRFCGNNEKANKDALKKVQEHDQIKNKYCEDNNINILRIPYWETKNIDKIIFNHLQRLNEKGSCAEVA